MPRHHADVEHDGDEQFACRNLRGPEFGADLVNLATHVSENRPLVNPYGALQMLIIGGRGQLMRKYRDVYVDMGPSPGPDLPHAWQGHSAGELLDEARQRHAANGLERLNHAAN